ncbi:hypothetical protein SAMN02910369_02813 [Lachnospiraceae bacterium NE2001]|nr:hypothetical protein SAMN02910369_02813 [Lachnospiraceae bacterium NE2001]
MTKKELVDNLKDYIGKAIDFKDGYGVKQISYGFANRSVGKETGKMFRDAFTSWSNLNYEPDNQGAYTGPRKEDYENTQFVKYYMMRYGLAYAFEYWVMYDAILRDPERDNKSQLAVSTFGCGNMIDAWSLAYARANIREEGKDIDLPENLIYRGTDGVKWGSLVIDNVKKLKGEFSEPPTENYLGISIENTTEDQFQSLWMDSNVFMFGKIMNELPDTTFQELIDNLKGMSFNQNEIYLCISHSAADIISINKTQKSHKRINDLVQAINYLNNYNVSDRILSQSSMAQESTKNGDGEFIGIESFNYEENPVDYGWYKFVASEQYYDFYNDETNDIAVNIEVLNPDFQRPEEWDWNEKEKRDFKFGLKKVDAPKKEFREPMKRSGSFRMQIIKLTKK